MTLKRWVAVAIVLNILILATAPVNAGKTTPSLDATPTPAEVTLLPLKANLSGTNSITITAGDNWTLNLTLTNTGVCAHTFKNSLTSAPNWITLKNEEVKIDPNKSGKLMLLLSPPANTSGEFPVRVKTESQCNPELFTTYEFIVKVVPQFEENAASGYALLTTPRAAAWIVGAGIFVAFIFAFWHRAYTGKKPENGSAAAGTVTTLAAPSSEVKTIVTEIYKEDTTPETEVETVSYTAPTNAKYTKLIPYDKEEGKRIWEV